MIWFYHLWYYLNPGTYYRAYCVCVVIFTADVLSKWEFVPQVRSLDEILIPCSRYCSSKNDQLRLELRDAKHGGVTRNGSVVATINVTRTSYWIVLSASIFICITPIVWSAGKLCLDRTSYQALLNFYCPTCIELSIKIMHISSVIYSILGSW